MNVQVSSSGKISFTPVFVSIFLSHAGMEILDIGVSLVTFLPCYFGMFLILLLLGLLVVENTRTQENLTQVLPFSIDILSFGPCSFPVRKILFLCPF